jgi:hypothetical protein
LVDEEESALLNAGCGRSVPCKGKVEYFAGLYQFLFLLFINKA